MYDFSKVKHTQLASVRARIQTWVSLVPKPTLFPETSPTRRSILGTLEPQNSGPHICSVQNMVHISRPIQTASQKDRDWSRFSSPQGRSILYLRTSSFLESAPLPQLHSSHLTANPSPSSICNIWGISFIHSWPTFELITG